MTHVRTSITTGLLLALAAHLAANENLRVVVQDVRPEFLNVSRDARTAVARGYQSKHTFQVIDVVEPAVLMVVDLPEQVTYAAMAPRNDWFIVSGEETIYRVDRITGEYEVLLTDTSGAVALNDDGKQLAVLGSLQVESATKRLAELREKFNPSGAQTAASRIFYPLPANDRASMLVDRRLSNGIASGLLNIRPALTWGLKENRIRSVICVSRKAEQFWEVHA